MPQISKIKYSDILKESSELRIEAEFYVNLNKFKITNFVFGEKIIDFVQYGTSKDLNEEKKGYPILRLNEFNGYYTGKPAKYSNLISEDTFNSLKLKSGDVFVCRTNGNPKLVGKAAICMKDQDIGFASYLFRIRTNKLINPETLMIFMNSNYGRNEIEKYSMVSNQANFSPAKFRQIKIPVLSDSFQLQIENMVKLAYENQTQSKTLYREAEELLLKELGLLDYTPKHCLSFSTTKKEIDEATRYDAEYFQPKYYDIIEKIEKYEGGWDFVGNQFKLINGKTPGVYFEEEKDIQVLKTKQVRNEAINYDGIVYSENELVDNILKDSDILFASMGVGSLGRTGIFYEFETNKKTSVDGTIKILRKKSKIEPEVLQTFFNSIIGQEYIYRYIVGSTGIISIKNDFIKNLKIPLIKPEIQSQIAEKVQESHRLRKESKDLLEEAKRKVEEEIEKGA